MAQKIRKNRVALTQMKRKMATLRKYLPVFEKQRAALNKMLQDEEVNFRTLSAEKEKLMRELDPWIALFNDSETDIGVLIKLKEIAVGEENVFGTTIPVFEKVRFEGVTVDFHYYPLWVPDGIEAVKRVVAVDAKLDVSTRRTQAIRRGYEEANQKVNLFDKKLIPEAQAAVKEIKTALDAQGIASIVIAKSAKKLQERRIAS